MGVKAAEIFSATPIQFGACRSVGTVQLPGLALLLLLALFASRKHLPGTIQQMLLPLTHLSRVDGLIGGDLLDRVAAIDRLRSDSGFEFGAMGAALAHEWGPHLKGGTPPQWLTIGLVQINQTTSNHGHIFLTACRSKYVKLVRNRQEKTCDYYQARNIVKLNQKIHRLKPPCPLQAVGCL